MAQRLWHCLAQGNLPPSLFPPDALDKAPTQITTVLPRGYTLTASTKNGELWHFYEEAQVTTAQTKNGIRLFIKFPIIDTRSTFDLFQIISIAQPIQNSTYARRLSPLLAYIAISENRQLFAELQTDEIANKCNA